MTPEHLLTTARSISIDRPGRKISVDLGDHPLSNWFPFLIQYGQPYQFLAPNGIHIAVVVSIDIDFDMAREGIWAKVVGDIV